MINSQNALGAVFFIVLFIGAILLATVDSFEPLTAYIISPPAFLIVLSFAGFTYIKKDKYEFDELGSVFKQDMVFGGWMGFLTGVSLSLSRFDGLDSLLVGFGASLITVLYGYVLGHMVDACWPNKV
jgi:hypothetical protein|tara:strand:+ start:401 stop:781 length:381 start_codon:yes stop_codon:yes gene_type:complete